MSKGLSYEYTGTKGHIVDVASSLPDRPEPLLKEGWEDISNPSGKEKGHWKLQEKSTGLIIGFDEGVKGEPGFHGKNHYHIFNPDATSNMDLYLDANGNPVPKSSKQSHILPGGV